MGVHIFYLGNVDMAKSIECIYHTEFKKMANEGNLIPITNRSSEEIREMGRKGGSVSSPAKKLAAKIRELKRKPPEEQVNRYVELLEDPNMSALDMMMLADEIEKECETTEQKIKLLNVKNSIHKAHHGEKIKTESRSINLQGDISDLVQFQKLMEKYNTQNQNVE